MLWYKILYSSSVLLNSMNVYLSILNWKYNFRLSAVSKGTQENVLHMSNLLCLMKSQTKYHCKRCPTSITHIHKKFIQYSVVHNLKKKTISQCSCSKNKL